MYGQKSSECITSLELSWNPNFDKRLFHVCWTANSLLHFESDMYVIYVYWHQQNSGIICVQVSHSLWPCWLPRIRVDDHMTKACPKAILCLCLWFLCHRPGHTLDAWAMMSLPACLRMVTWYYSLRTCGSREYNFYSSKRKTIIVHTKCLKTQAQHACITNGMNNTGTWCFQWPI